MPTRRVAPLPEDQEEAFPVQPLSAEEARVLVDKADAFQAVLSRELLTAVLTDPDLAGVLSR